MPGPLIEGSIEVAQTDDGNTLKYRFTPPDAQVVPVARETMEQIIGDLQTLMDTQRLLKLTKNCNDWLLWHMGRFEKDAGGTWRTVEEDRLFFSVMCNDIFAWGTADSEYVLASDLNDLEQALNDVREVTGGIHDDMDGMLLWAARKRGMRPQGAFFAQINEALWPLFLAAGPERAVDIANPNPIPEPRKSPEEGDDVVPDPT